MNLLIKILCNKPNKICHLNVLVYYFPNINIFYFSSGEIRKLYLLGLQRFYVITVKTEKDYFISVIEP